MSDHDYEMVAQHVSVLSERVATYQEHLTEVEKVNARLEAAALITSRALEEIARHWNAVYEAMRRQEEPDDLEDDLREALRSEGYDVGLREGE